MKLPMRLTSLVVILTVLLSGCSTSSSSRFLTGLGRTPTAQTDDKKTAVKTERKSDQASDVMREQLTVKRFKELDAILASDIESRDLPRAKSLISELKGTVTGSHPRQKELAIAELWINDSIGYREHIDALEQQARLLKSEISKHKEALEDVRRTLVSE